MITKYCKACGAQVAIDENAEKFFCSYCGAENIVDRINSGFAANAVSQTTTAMPNNPMSSANIYIDYKTTNSNVKMTIIIDCIGKQYVFKHGESIELLLPEGMQVIRFKIGSTTYIKTITIQNGLLNHINCSWDNGQFYINSDYPHLIMNGIVNKSGSTKSNSGCGTVIGIVAGVFLFMILFSGLVKYISTANKARSSSNNTTVTSSATNGNASNTVSTSAATSTSTEVDKEAFIDSCTELDFKALARNPDEYIGQNFYFVCYVFSVRTGGLFTGYQRYFITYEFDLDKAQQRVEEGRSDSISDAKSYCYDTDVCVWMLDNRDESSSEYVKVLDKDVVIIYGTFTGLTESQNSLTGETSEQVSLDVKYVELVSD